MSACYDATFSKSDGYNIPSFVFVLNTGSISSLFNSSLGRISESTITESVYFPNLSGILENC